MEVVIVDDSTHSFSHSMPEAVEALLDERVHYIYSPERMSIGEKRNLALARSSGDVMITWDDDDLYRTHRISTQVRRAPRGPFPRPPTFPPPRRQY